MSDGDVKELYRYEAKAEYGGWEGERLDGVRIVLRTLPVRRATPCGVWVWDKYKHKERWVSLTGRKRYAYPDKELAMDSFKIRNRWRIGYLKRDLQHAEMAKAALETEELYMPSLDAILEKAAGS